MGGRLTACMHIFEWVFVSLLAFRFRWYFGVVGKYYLWVTIVGLFRVRWWLPSVGVSSFGGGIL